MVNEFLELSIEPMLVEHVEQLLAEYHANDAEYLRYFTPFEFTAESITGLISRAVNDRYFILKSTEEVAGCYILRGIDSGYAIPSYGVWISKRFSGRGFARQTLLDAIATARMMSAPAIMLKVHPENLRARTIYEKFGFRQTGFDSKNGNLVFHLALI